MGTFVNLIGQKFGRLTVISFDKIVKKKKYYWICKCACGNIKPIWSGALKNGSTKSCGCLKLETMRTCTITHGYTMGRSSTAEYRSWQAMKGRCLNPKNQDYRLYGGRGIKIYKDWINDFPSFLKYMGKRTSNKHSLDRYPNKNGNYEPNNVRWATQLQQMQNVSRNIVITYDNKTMVLAQWGRCFGVTGGAIKSHIDKGRTIDQIAAFYKYKKDNNITTWIPFQLFD